VFFTVYLWIDTIMLSLMTGAKVVGWYGAATTLFQTLMFIPTLLSTTWLPRLVAAFEESPSQLLRTARKPVELVLLISAPMAAGMAMVSPIAVRVLYGSSYHHAVPVVTILGLCLPPTYLSIILAQVLVAAGRQRVYQWLMVAATVVNPALNLILIPAAQHRYHNGAIGAAAALLGTELLVALGGYMAIRGVFDRAMLGRWMRALGASAAMWAVARESAPVGVVPAAGLGVIAFAALVYALRILGAEEFDAMRVGLARVKDKIRPAASPTEV
jgi:O-antigen/teichoic acid export membrane protein